MIAVQNVFDRLVRNNLIRYNTIRKIATGDDNTAGCLPDYTCFKNYYKMTEIDLSKQQARHADSKTIQQINFTGNLAVAAGATMFFIIEEAKETALDFPQAAVKVLSVSNGI